MSDVKCASRSVRWLNHGRSSLSSGIEGDEWLNPGALSRFAVQLQIGGLAPCTHCTETGECIQVAKSNVKVLTQSEVVVHHTQLQMHQVSMVNT